MTIADFNRMMAEEKVCGDCPMRGRSFVGADSRSGETGHADILFLGLNPGREEARQGLPFVGPSGRFLRSALRIADNTWAIINSILCSSPNETGIASPDRARECCRRNVARAWAAFTPDIIVPCGNGAAAVFEISDGITAAERKCYVSRGRGRSGKPTLVMPIQHPSALIRSGGESSPKYRGWMKRIMEIFQMANALKSHGCPEDMLDEKGIAWTGLFGCGK